MNEIKGFVGTYAPGKGIYSFLYDVQKEEFVKTDLFYPVKDAKYLSYYKNRLAFPTQLTDAGSCMQVWKTVLPVTLYRMGTVFILLIIMMVP